MTYQNPHMLPKVRSEDLTESANWHKFGIGCTARVSSFIPGHRCSSDETTVFAHYGSLGKGTGTKTSDINGVVACLHCHDLIDGPLRGRLVHVGALRLAARVEGRHVGGARDPGRPTERRKGR